MSAATVLDFGIDLVRISSTNYEQARGNSGKVAFLFVAIAPRTWSRARHRNTAGPPPVRAGEWLWGFPWNDVETKNQVEEDYASVRFGMRVAHELAEHNQAASIVIGALEQFGPASRGMLASIWNLPEIRGWARKARFWRIAVHQCEPGPAKTPKPTAFLINHAFSLAHAKRGWPIFKCSQGSISYAGPLANRCDCVDKRRHESYTRPQARQALLTFSTVTFWVGWACSAAATTEKAAHARKPKSKLRLTAFVVDAMTVSLFN